MLRLVDTEFAKFAPSVAVGASMLSITVGASLAEFIFPNVGPIGVTSLRIVLASIVLSCAFRVWRVKLGQREVFAAIPYGLSLAGMNLLFYMAIQRIPLGIAIAIEFTGPLCLAMFSSRRIADFGWMGLASIGLLLLLPLQTAQGAIDPIGVGLSLGAGVFWAAYIVTGKRAGSILGVRAAAIGMIVAALAVAPIGLISAGPALWQPHVIAIGLCVALLSSAIPYSLEMFALRRLPARTFGILVSGEPAIGALVGICFLGETLPSIRCFGIMAIILASIGTTISTGKENALAKADPLLV